MRRPDRPRWTYCTMISLRQCNSLYKERKYRCKQIHGTIAVEGTVRKGSQTFTHHECGKRHKFHVAAAGSGKALFQPCDCHN